MSRTCVSLIAIVLAHGVALVAGAGCPPPGDLAPGRASLDGTAWIASGDARISAADAVALGRLVSGDWLLAPLACRAPGDIAPGIARAGSWSPARNGILDECDRGALRDLVLGRRVPAEDPALDAGSIGGGTFGALRDEEAARTLGLIGDDELLSRMADLLEACDAAPLGAALLEAWIEGAVHASCALPEEPAVGLAEGGAIIQPQGGAVADIARIRATASWRVIERLVQASAFDDGGNPLARRRGLLLAAVAVTVRVEALDAWHGGAIDAQQLGLVLGQVPGNPFKAWRTLLEMLGQPAPPWATGAHDECLRGCEPESCAGGVDEDADGLIACDDDDCALRASCAAPPRPGLDDPATVALLHADGGGDAAPGCLRDESGKRWEGVASGVPACDETTWRFAPASLRFDGDHGATSASEDFAFGAGDFTIDWHAHVEAGGSGPMQGHRRMISLGSTTHGLQVATEWSNASGKVALWAGDGSQWLVLERIGTTSLFGGWHHLALVRSGNTLRVFVDGQPEIVADVPPAWSVAGEPRVTLGHAHGSSDGFLMQGWMDEIRVTKGLARWVSRFTPPGRPHEGLADGPDSSGTVALLHFDGIEGSATFSDETGRAWTPVPGEARVTQDEARLGAGSLRLSGGGGIVTKASPDLDFGSGDFTLEAWAWFDATDASWDFVFARGTDGSNLLQLYRYADQLWFHESATIGNISASGIAARQWQHVAVTRQAGTFRMFIDGRLAAEQHHGGAVLDGGEVFGVGCRPSSPWPFTGNLDEVRISKGVARYVADFDPPGAPFEPDGTGGLLPGTLALLHGDGAAGSDVVVDATGREWTWQGGPVTLESPARFGDTSLRFERGRHLATQASPDLDFGTGDFTIDAWVRFDSFDASFDMVFGRGISDPGRFLLYRTGNALYFYDGATVGNIGGPGLVAATWHHCAVTRRDGTFRVFIDGRMIAAAHHPGATLDAGEPFMIGQQPIYPYGLAANVDELRIVKGVAAWTADFIPPTRAYGWP